MGAAVAGPVPAKYCSNVRLDAEGHSDAVWKLRDTLQCCCVKVSWAVYLFSLGGKRGCLIQIFFSFFKYLLYSVFKLL